MPSLTPPQIPSQPTTPVTRRRAAGAVAAAAGLLAALAPLAASRAGAAAVELPPPVYEVEIVASYDAEAGVIHGRERLRWRNTASVPVDELVFHLYLNAFSSDRTTFMRESGGRLRNDRFDRDRWGWIEVESIVLGDDHDLAPGGGEDLAPGGGEDLAPGGVPWAPDDGNPDDRTLMRYPLPAPLPPGEWVEVDIGFESRLPTIFARTGVHGEYVFAGQWFPKVAVFEDAGVRGRESAGWSAHQFHAMSEFYADFGDYDVTLTLPERYRGRVGATGREVDPAPGATGGEGTVTVRFVQRGVHDFAWSADPRFVVVRESFDPALDVPDGLRRRIAAGLGMAPGELELTPVELILMLPPAHRSQAGRQLAAARAALAGFGLRLGAYPYETLTLIDPPAGAGGSAGMEYPTLVTLGSSPWLGLPPLRGIRLPELVTVHEVGHQWFQGMIASNEFEEPWIDEGITSFYEMRVTDEALGAAAELPGLVHATMEELNRAAVAGARYRDPVVAPSWRYMTFGSYGFNTYPRPAIALAHLENLIGADTFARALRAFFQEHRFSHPGTADFERTVERVSGRDLGWFFAQALHSARRLDYAVSRLVTEKQRRPGGVTWEGGTRHELPDEGDENDGDEDGGGDRWRSEVVVTREGEFVHPVTVELRFSDGRTLRREWDGEERWARWRFEGPARLVAAVVDPDRVMALDVDRLNDGRLADPEPLPARALAADLFYWLGRLFHAASWLA